MSNIKKIEPVKDPIVDLVIMTLKQLDALCDPAEVDDTDFTFTDLAWLKRLHTAVGERVKQVEEVLEAA